MTDIVMSIQDLARYNPLSLSPEETVFLKKYLSVLIESRPGSVKASEASTVGGLYDKLTSYLHQVIESEKKRLQSEKKLLGSEKKLFEMNTSDEAQNGENLTESLPIPKL
jgi:hypothetical protein